MKLFKAKDCVPCAHLGEYIKNNDIKIPTELLSFEELRAGKFPFKQVPSLVLDDETVISGFPQIRLWLSKRI